MSDVSNMNATQRRIVKQPGIIGLNLRGKMHLLIKPILIGHKITIQRQDNFLRFLFDNYN